MLLANGYRPDPRVLKEAHALSAGGYPVTIIAWDREGDLPADERDSGIHIRRVQNVRSSYGAGFRQMLRLPRFWRQAWRMLNEEQPDIVHCHDFDTLPPGLLWAKLHRKPVIYDAHDYYAEMQAPRLTGLIGKALLRAFEAADQFLSRLVDAVITVDERIARRYRNRTVVIIGHYPPLNFAPQSNPENIADQTAATPKPTLIYSGRLSTDRGLLVIAKLMQSLAQQGLNPRLRLMGTWTSSTEEADFNQAVAGVEEQVEYVGWIPFKQVPDQLVQADIALAILQPVPRYTKAVPVKLLEYMACALPVVISDFPYNRALVEDAECGLLVDPTDVTAVTAVVARLLTDQQLASRLGANGAVAFRDRYNWEVLTPRLLDLYNSLLA